MRRCSGSVRSNKRPNVIHDVAAGHLNALNAVAAATNRRDRRFAMMTLRSRSKQSWRSSAAQKTAKKCRTIQDKFDVEIRYFLSFPAISD
jgi:hypothetical protein